MEIFPNETTHFLMLLIGARRSGKTHLLKHKLLGEIYKDKYDLIYLITPSNDFDDVEPTEFFFKFKEYDGSIIESIMTQQLKILDINPDIKTLVILDDCMSGRNFKQNTEENVLNTIATRGRHLNISMIVTAQHYIGVSTSFRHNADVIVSFERHNNHQLFKERDIVDTYKKFKQITDIATKSQYSYLVISSFHRDYVFFYDADQDKFFSIAI